MTIPGCWRPVPLLLLLAGCGGSSPSPTGPSTPTSFLAGGVDRDGDDRSQSR